MRQLLRLHILYDEFESHVPCAQARAIILCEAICKDITPFRGHCCRSFYPFAFLMNGIAYGDCIEIDCGHSLRDERCGSSAEEVGSTPPVQFSRRIYPFIRLYCGIVRCGYFKEGTGGREFKSPCGFSFGKPYGAAFSAPAILTFPYLRG